jgi:4'-phosphopantetheinyl transferase
MANLVSLTALPERGAVHLWRMPLDVASGRRQRLRRTLCQEELARAERLRGRADRNRFVVCHGAVREILGGYLAVAPGELRLGDAGRGQPALAEPEGTLRFSLSRSGGQGLLAVRSNGAVGIDLERIDGEFDWRPIAAGFFTARENRELSSLTPRAGAEAFFSCWTRKEAYLKARGEGLADGLDGFEVAVGRDCAARLAAEGVVDAGGRAWWIRGCAMGCGYAAAVAGEGRMVSLQWRKWAT